jgi:predicted small lipoprotein YifL
MVNYCLMHVSQLQNCSYFKVVVLPMLAALAAAGRSGPLNYTPDWWTGAVEEDAIRSLPLDGEGGLWTSSFIPPPPRPDFLDDHATPDGLTTCDLCTWAWREKGLFSLDPTQGIYVLLS